MIDNYIYKFINYEDEIIYIGKTGNIKKRMKQHFGPKPHLPKECYEQVYKIYYASVNSKYNAEFLETFFINKYHPIYNTDKKYKKDENDLKVAIDEPYWNELLFLRTKTKNYLPSIEFLDIYPPYFKKGLMLNESIEIAFNYNFSKINYYSFEFNHLCPSFLKLLNDNTKQIKELYKYAKLHINREECNIDESLTTPQEEQMNEHYLAFNLDKIKELSKIAPDFNLMLKYKFIECLTKDIFIVKMITPFLLKSVEENIKRTQCP